MVGPGAPTATRDFRASCSKGDEWGGRGGTRKLPMLLIDVTNDELGFQLQISKEASMRFEQSR